MITWTLMLLSFWIGYGVGTGDVDEVAIVMSIPTILTIIYLILRGLSTFAAV